MTAKKMKEIESMIKETLGNNDEITPTGIRNLLSKNDGNLLSAHAFIMHVLLTLVIIHTYMHVWYMCLVES